MQASNKYFNKRMNKTEFNLNKQLLATVTDTKKNNQAYKEVYDKTAQLKVTIFD
jgi:hypothetical protein